MFGKLLELLLLWMLWEFMTGFQNALNGAGLG